MDISRILTKEEKIFIKEHGLSYSDFCDARGEIAKVYHDKAKALGCRYVINSCMYGLFNVIQGELFFRGALAKLVLSILPRVEITAK